MSCQPCYNTVNCWVPPFSKKPCTDLSVRIELQVDPEGSILYMMFVTNNGPITANNVVLNVNFIGTLSPLLPPFPGPAYGITPPFWFISGSTGTLNIGALNSGQTYTVTNLPGPLPFIGPRPFIAFMRNAPSSLTAVVTSEIRDCNPNNNTASASYTPSP